VTVRPTAKSSSGAPGSWLRAHGRSLWIPERRGEREERQQVLQLAVDVLAVERLFMMAPMQRIDLLNQDAPQKKFTGVVIRVQNIAVRDVLDKGPDRHAGQIEWHRHKRMGRARGQYDHQQRNCRVKESNRQ